MNFVRKLTELREKKNLNQQEIAELLETRQTTISKYELGQRKYKIEDLIKLCRYYNVSADYILGLPKNMPYPDEDSCAQEEEN